MRRFSDRHVVFVAQRRMVRKPARTQRMKQQRPRSRTLKAVHDATLEDLVYPTEIVGKRLRQSTDGRKTVKVFLDPKDANALEYKLESFSSVRLRPLAAPADRLDLPSPDRQGGPVHLRRLGVIGRSRATALY